MATLSIQQYDESGADLTMSAASSGGDQFANSGQEEIIIVNNDSAAKTVTITAQQTSFDDAVFGNANKQDQSVQVSASGGVAVIGPFPRAAFNDSNSNVQISYSAGTSLEIAVVRRK